MKTHHSGLPLIVFVCPTQNSECNRAIRPSTVCMLLVQRFRFLELVAGRYLSMSLRSSICGQRRSGRTSDTYGKANTWMKQETVDQSRRRNRKNLKTALPRVHRCLHRPYAFISPHSSSLLLSHIRPSLNSPQPSSDSTLTPGSHHN